MKSAVSARLNVDLLDEKYEQWKLDPQSVEVTWSAFFEGFELGLTQLKQKGESPGKKLTVEEEEVLLKARVVNAIYIHRTLGHTAAWIDPLSFTRPEQPRLTLSGLGFKEKELDVEVSTQFFCSGEKMKLGEMLGRLQKIYCDKIGFEFMHIHNTEVRNWIRERIENREKNQVTERGQKEIFQWLVEAELFETFLSKKFLGQKRFSLEGGESFIVILNTILQNCPRFHVREIVMGMAHRGRLNVLANFLNKSLKILLYEFMDYYVPDLLMGDGDVKYHLGYETKRTVYSGEEVDIFLAANPSHLEAVNSVVEGKARARQRILKDTEKRKAVLPLLIHGDAAFAGQGSVAEVLNLSQLPGYRTGGTIHVIVNNQIGFTTMPADARSSNYATDVAKMIEAPIFHVNGDCPLEVKFVTELAMEFRQEFGRDVVLDMYCYRKHGHNEADEAAFTQPKLTRKIKSKESVKTLFKEELIEKQVLSEKEADTIEENFWERLETEFKELKEHEKEGKGNVFIGSTAKPQQPFSFKKVSTGISKERLRELGEALTTVPPGFNLHPTIKKRFLPRRREAMEKGEKYDWAYAEALAFASLLVEGYPVRLSGQDSRRGTFSQRHAVFYDTETRERYIPLQNLSPDQSRFCVYNSLLSETAVMGFDYGYSLVMPDMLILWEAQFGDFANGAQVIIDQFIVSAESKWQRPSGIVLLLPHGYEGMGPEHSSARMERFLQMCSGKNIQVGNLTTPAQYFHVMRRQLIRPFRKPLILMTPKSLLTHPQAVSREEDFLGKKAFQEIIDDDSVRERALVNRLIFCSGKVYYDLVNYRKENKIEKVAIIRFEQIYPFHWKLLEKIVRQYPATTKWVWCQEEPLNMGAWNFMAHRLQKVAGHAIRYAARDTSASPATGAMAVHRREQKKLIEDAFSV